MQEVDPYVGKTIMNFHVDKLVGKGAFGKVYKVRENDNDSSPQDEMAMKMMDLNDIAINELAVLIRRRHKNVVKYYEHFQFITKTDDDQTSTKLCIITEFCKVAFNFY